MMRGKLRNPNLILEEVPEAERSQNLSVNEDEDDALDMDDGIPFTKKMRMETRKIHNISDALVNAKLGLAMSDDRIWAEGLLIFYEIFKFLEAAMLRLSAAKYEPFDRMQKVIAGIERTEAFEQDLDFYHRKPGYTKDKDEYQIRPSVQEYLRHLQFLEQREPLRLLAYIYHLYMGLLSGGQILKRKRELRNRFRNRVCGFFQWFGLSAHSGGMVTPSLSSSSSSSVIGPKPGEAVTYFGDGRSISDIKNEIRFTMDDIASDLSRDEKNAILDESINVFRLNNEIVGSIQHTGLTALKNYAAFLLVLFSIGSAVFLYWSYA